jgi:hypothetical protein
MDCCLWDIIELPIDVVDDSITNPHVLTKRTGKTAVKAVNFISAW